MKKIYLYLLSLVFTTTAAFADLSPIKFATEATYPPFVSMTSDGKMVGFDADLVHALCQQMKNQCVLINAPWESLIPGLQMGKYDALFGGMAITKQREQVVNFTSPYYQNSVVFVSDKKSKFNLESMTGNSIGVQGGTEFQNYLQAVDGDKITIKTYLSNMTALMDLQAGRVDAVFIDQPVAKLWLDTDDHAKNYKIAGSVDNAEYFGKGNGIAVNKNNQGLLANLNEALVKIKQNGTYNTIVTKWFGSNK